MSPPTSLSLGGTLRGLPGLSGDGNQSRARLRLWLVLSLLAGGDPRAATERHGGARDLQGLCFASAHVLLVTGCVIWKVIRRWS